MNIRNFLIKNGVYPNLKGFNYLVRSVEIIKSKHTMLVTKELYPKIAKEFKTTASKVERSIRHIITTKLNISDYKELGLNKKPSNSELIYYFATMGGK